MSDARCVPPTQIILSHEKKLDQQQVQNQQRARSDGTNKLILRLVRGNGMALISILTAISRSPNWGKQYGEELEGVVNR